MRTLFLLSLTIPAVFAAPGASFAKPTTMQVSSDQVIAACGHYIRSLPYGAVGCLGRPCGSTTCDYVCVPGGCYVTINLATSGLGKSSGVTVAQRALPALPPPSLSTSGGGGGGGMPAQQGGQKGQGNGQGPAGAPP